jgi:hypothetical protein
VDLIPGSRTGARRPIPILVRARQPPRHRVRVEHDNHTLLVHVSDEDGGGWTTIAIDRASRAWSVAQRDTQLAAATSASEALYND